MTAEHRDEVWRAFCESLMAVDPRPVSDGVFDEAARLAREVVAAVGPDPQARADLREDFESRRAWANRAMCEALTRAVGEYWMATEALDLLDEPPWRGSPDASN